MAGKGWQSLASRWLRFLLAYWRANLAAQMEYRASFASQVLAMFLNDGLWVAFWALYFQRFPVVRGWALPDVLTLWAVVALAFGLMCVLAGGALQLPRLVAEGQMDFYLTLPRPVLPHLLVSRTGHVSAWGDVIFGPVVFFCLAPWTWDQALRYLLVSALAAVVFTSFAVLVGSLAFFVGNAELLAQNALNALIHFSTYPAPLFDGWGKAVIYTVIPAAFVGSVPVEVVRRFGWGHLALLAGAAAALSCLATAVFYWGLRRYESGNLVRVQG